VLANILFIIILFLGVSCVGEGDDVSSRYVTVCIDGIKYHMTEAGSHIALAVNKITLFPMRCP